MVRELVLKCPSNFLSPKIVTTPPLAVFIELLCIRTCECISNYRQRQKSDSSFALKT